MYQIYYLQSERTPLLTNVSLIAEETDPLSTTLKEIEEYEIYYI